MKKVALVTGAAKRLGAACVELLHDAGFDVALHYHHSEVEAVALAERLSAKRPESIRLFRADLLQLQQVESLAVQVLDAWGQVDVLVNNASLFLPGEVGCVSEEDWDSLLGCNLKAPFFLSQALAPALAWQRGSIVNITDIHAERCLTGFPVYSIAKAGLTAMTKALAKELAPEVRVNAVAPGAILWPEHEFSEQQKGEVLQKIALRRSGTVADIAEAVKFLADDAEYVTGHVLTVDGGRSLFT